MSIRAAILLATVLRGPADVETLTREADAVVHARVEQRTSSISDGQIFTRVKLRVVAAWKGGASGALTVVVPGGVAGELDQIVQGAASFHDGEEVVVFLRRRAEGVYEVHDLALGKFTVGAASSSSPRRALRDRSGLACPGCFPTEQDDYSLDELRARVLGSAAK